MIILSADQLEKSYGANLILDGLSFELQDHDRIGIVGRNGAGKTTLFKLISGIESIDAGVINKKRNLRIGYLEQIPSVPTGLTGKEVLQMAFEDLLKIEKEMHELSNGLSDHSHKGEEDQLLEQKLLNLDELQKQFELRGGYEMDVQLNRIVEGLKIKEMLLSRAFEDMSGGEKTRILLGRILLEAPELLLLDEPTNHLDLEALEWLEGYLATYNGAMLMISHDRQFLDQVATKILEFDDKACKVWLGNYSKFKQDRDDWLQQQVEIYRQQQKKVRAMEEAIHRFEDWGGRTNNKAMFVKARNMQKRIDKLDKIDRPKTKEKDMGLSFKAESRTGNVVFRLENVVAGYDQKPLVKNVDLEINYQERAVLMGANGVGKTTLFKLLMGTLEPIEGRVKIGSRVKIGYLEQEVNFEQSERTVLQLFNEETGIGEFQARGKLARFMFFSEDLSKKVNSLSGGERVKLKLCLMMEQGITVLLMDEPTNHMDIPSREILEIALEEFEGTVLMISHDRYFIRRLAERLIFLSANGIKQFDGDYDDWREFESEKKEIVQEVVAKKVEAVNAWRNTEDRNKQNEARRNQKKLSELEGVIEKQEMALKNIEAELAEGSLPYEQLIALCERQKIVKELLDEASFEWLELSED
jgi:ATP-binding cassette subfamily F protein 3